MPRFYIRFLKSYFFSRLRVILLYISIYRSINRYIDDKVLHELLSLVLSRGDLALYIDRSIDICQGFAWGCKSYSLCSPSHLHPRWVLVLCMPFKCVHYHLSADCFLYVLWLSHGVCESRKGKGSFVAIFKHSLPWVAWSDFYIQSSDSSIFVALQDFDCFLYILATLLSCNLLPLCLNDLVVLWFVSFACRTMADNHNIRPSIISFALETKWVRIKKCSAKLPST